MTCRTCHSPDLQPYIGRNGKTGYRRLCRECFRESDRERCRMRRAGHFEESDRPSDLHEYSLRLPRMGAF